MAQHKAQVAVEFFILVTFMLFVFIAFFVLITDRITEHYAAQNYGYLVQVGDIIKTEVNLFAMPAVDGYRREFELPRDLPGGNYSMLFLEETTDPDNQNVRATGVYINYTTKVGTGYSAALPRNVKVEGPLLPGFNNITKRDNVIVFNPVEGI